MRRLALLTFQTLNGVMQAPMSPEEDMSGGFDEGGWATPYWPGIMGQVWEEAMSEPYDILFGRNTYDSFAAFWPNAEANAFSDRMNGAKKYVVSSAEPDLSWNNSTHISGDFPAEIAALKQQDGPLLQVHGSTQLARTLIAHGLVDEFRLWWFPVIVGSGKRLFDTGKPYAPLSLKKCGQSQDGVVMTLYDTIQSRD